MYFVEVDGINAPKVVAISHWRLGGLVHTHTEAKEDFLLAQKEAGFALPRLKLC
jgi:hypothetical protein